MLNLGRQYGRVRATAQEPQPEPPWQIALRDASIVAAIYVITNLLSIGYVYACGHVGEVVYQTCLSFLLMFLVSIANAYRIRGQKPP